MIHLTQAVIVEGKYDKIKLSRFLDAEIIITDGFRIFRDKQKAEMIRQIAKKRGIIIITDSDSAGFLIRGHLNGIVDKECITNVFIPQIRGRERRKTTPSAEGFLGVEGVSEEVIRDALKKYGIALDGTKSQEGCKWTSADLYRLGLSGGENSGIKRTRLLEKLGFPKGMSTKQLLTALSLLYSFKEIEELLGEEK